MLEMVKEDPRMGGGVNEVGDGGQSKGRLKGGTTNSKGFLSFLKNNM